MRSYVHYHSQKRKKRTVLIIKESVLIVIVFNKKVDKVITNLR